MIVEVCANSLQSAMNAQNAGASRIELCSELGVGGVTPSYGMLQKVRELVRIPIHVLIRPRSGDFTYTEAELDIMAKDIEACRKLGFEGIVSGVLHGDLNPDLERTAALMAHGKGMHFTFHRAFDWVPHPLEALRQLEGIGIATILSSGQASVAAEGMALLTALREAATYCTLMPGGGINPSNAGQFKEKKFNAIHLSAAVPVKSIGKRPALSMNTPAYVSDDHRMVSQEDVIRAVLESVK